MAADQAEGQDKGDAGQAPTTLGRRRPQVLSLHLHHPESTGSLKSRPMSSSLAASPWGRPALQRRNQGNSPPWEAPLPAEQIDRESHGLKAFVAERAIFPLSQSEA